MSQKHFEVLAYNLSGTRPTFSTKSERLIWAKTVIAVANSCAELNPKFNRNKFYDACGGIDDCLD